MKNREHFRNTIIENIGTRGKHPCDFIRTHVFTYYGVGDCYNSMITCAWCHVLLEMWLEEEYIDWLKVPVDTLVKVKTHPYEEWNPIVNGDLSEVPRDGDILFTVFDEQTGEVYTAIGEVSDYFLQEGGYVFVGVTSYPVYRKSLKAWMELPEPYEPGRCDKCKYLEQ